MYSSGTRSCGIPVGQVPAVTLALRKLLNCIFLKYLVPLLWNKFLPILCLSFTVVPHSTWSLGTFIVFPSLPF